MDKASDALDEVRDPNKRHPIVDLIAGRPSADWIGDEYKKALPSSHMPPGTTPAELETEKRMEDLVLRDPDSALVYPPYWKTPYWHGQRTYSPDSIVDAITTNPIRWMPQFRRPFFMRSVISKMGFVNLVDESIYPSTLQPSEGAPLSQEHEDADRLTHWQAIDRQIGGAAQIFFLATADDGSVSKRLYFNLVCRIDATHVDRFYNMWAWYATLRHGEDAEVIIRGDSLNHEGPLVAPCDETAPPHTPANDCPISPNVIDRCSLEDVGGLAVQ